MKEDTIRLYQFMPDEYGRMNLHNRQLKVSFPDQVNDLFEMMPFDFGEGLKARRLRKVWKEDIKYNSKKLGFISFSESWSVPTMWAHYAANHCGVCLGFDVLKSNVEKVDYVKSLKKLNFEKLHKDPNLLDETLSYAQRTKSKHWEYEEEWRMFCMLNHVEQADKEIEPDKLFFLNFSDRLTLREVIFGHRSTLTTSLLKELLKPTDRVTFNTARPSFRKFAMVPQKTSPTKSD